MPTHYRNRLPQVLDQTALFLTASAIVLRWLVIGSATGPGLNLTLHLLFWVALGLWFAGRALAGGVAYRFTGVEFPLLAFVIVAQASVQGASFVLPALDQAFAFLSYALLFVLAVQLLGRRGILSLLVPTLAALSLYGMIQFVIFPMLLGEVAKTNPELLTEDLIRRIESREVIATFAGPNQFAGFLALGIPLLVGILLDRRGSGKKALLAPGIALVLTLIVLPMTGSLGGWIALAAGAAAFAGLAATRTRGRTPVLAAGGLAAALLVSLLFVPASLDAMAEKSHSMHVRSVYWKAAGRMVADAPLIGVGLDNYQEHYFERKSDVPQETHRVHNDYLQLLVDAGAAGLLAFLALLALGLRRALARRADPVPDPDALPPWLIPSVGALALLWYALTGGLRIDLAVILVGGWFGIHFLSSRDGDAPSSEWTRIGAAAGFVALLVHMLVDFDLYTPGLGLALFLILPLVVLLQGKRTDVRLGRPVCIASAAVLLIVALPLLLFVAPNALAADREIADADRAVRALASGRLEPAPAAAALEAATRASEAAQQHNPFDPEGYALYAQANFFVWHARRGDAAESAVARTELQRQEGIVLQAIENAIALRPRLSPYHEQKARYHRAFHDFYRRLAGERPESALESAAYATFHLDEALRSQEEARRLYPTIWLNPYNLARLLDLKGRGDEAQEHYREALRLSDRASAEQWAVRRMQLPPVKRARCLLRTGEADRARKDLAAAFRETVKDMDPRLRSVKLKREDYRKLFRIDEDEDDTLLRPLIDAAIDAVTK